MKRSAKSLRLLALTGVWSGLAAFVPYAEPIPWLELQTLVVFTAGYFLGPARGAAVGALAMVVYSLANPYGPAHPLVFASQLLGRAADGALGGACGRVGLSGHLGVGARQLALWSIAASLAFDLPTNVATAAVFGPMLPVLLAGLPFAGLHLASNVALFWIVGTPLTRALDERRALLLGGAWLLASGAAQLAGVPPEAHAQAAPAERDTAETRGPWIPLPGDTVRVSPPDTARAALADTAGVLPDTLRVALSPRQPVSRTTPEPAWSLTLEPADVARLHAADADDVIPYLAGAPRFYGDVGSVEETAFAALPGLLETAFLGAMPVANSSTPWSDPVGLPDGGVAGAGWSPRGRRPPTAYPGSRSPVEEAHPDVRSGVPANPDWGYGEAHPIVGRPLTSVWVGAGSDGRRTQGFDLQFWQGIRGTLWRGRWGAWSRNAGVLGRLGDSGSHANTLGLTGRGTDWIWDLEYRSHRAALGDIGSTIGERRSRVGLWTSGLWESAGGVALGLRLGLQEDGTTGEGAILEPLRRLSNECWIQAHASASRGDWTLGGEILWRRERVEYRLSDTTRYAPAPLEEAALSGRAERPLFGGHARVSLALDRAGGSTALLPTADWTRGLGEDWRLWLGAGAVRRSRVAEAGKLVDSFGGPTIERSTGASGVVGVRWRRGAAAATASTPAHPGTASRGGFVHADLALVAWTIEGALFPSYGLFARDVLEGTAVTAEVQGASLVANLAWAPLTGLEVGGTGYAAGREVPEAAASGVPDYRVLLWAGPRLSLFRSSVEFQLRAEADRIGPRPAGGGGSLESFWRLGGRAALGFGDAWLVFRVIDLAGAEAALPGVGRDGVPLTTPGTQWRLYGEWRLLD